MEGNVKNKLVYTIPFRRSDNSFNVSNISKRKKKYAKVKKLVTVNTGMIENKMPENEVVFQPALLATENELNTQVSYTNDFVQETPITENITTNEIQTPLTEYQFGQYSINTENKLTEINPTIPLQTEPTITKNVGTSYDADSQTLGLITTTTSSPLIENPAFTQNITTTNYDYSFATETTDIPTTKYVDNTNDYNNLQNIGLTTSYTATENTTPIFNQNIAVTKIENIGTTVKTDIPNTTTVTDIPTTTTFDNIGTTTVTDIPTTTTFDNIGTTTVTDIPTTTTFDNIGSTTVTDIPTIATFDNIETTTVTDMPNTTYINNTYTNDYNNLQNVGLKTSYAITDNTKPAYNQKITDIPTTTYVGNIGTTINDIPTTTDFDNRNTKITHYDNIKNIELTKSYAVADNSMPTYNQNQVTNISNIPYESNNININTDFSNTEPLIDTNSFPTTTSMQAPITTYNEYPTTTSFSIANQPIATLNTFPYKSASPRIDVTTSYDNVGSHNYSINSYRSSGKLSIPPGARTQTEIVPVEEIKYIPVKQKKFIRRKKVFVPTIKKVPIKKTIYVRRPREK